MIHRNTMSRLASINTNNQKMILNDIDYKLN